MGIFAIVIIKLYSECGILTCEDSDEPVQPPFSLETPNDVPSVA